MECSMLITLSINTLLPYCDLFMVALSALSYPRLQHTMHAGMYYGWKTSESGAAGDE